ncbi:hypothetical protein CI109_107344 [Kwoniella shandongensis]|uniref:Hyaluronan/mRNA-binding protein domain-containing protein n=1 Tax=Kwoniella shandongensis TaxID=1734106 RepID=A0A5M6BXA8_9TREE|nr:uncharacterized protein CI109_004728 [Kwoniella shandongensis]KAA5526951.1 hypothetical protein CI109_004728 [Kwoniella shandongensis]
MTRTERNQYPAALLKDRHSRSGLTKTELAHKGGDGAHNWGSLKREGEAEAGGRLDAENDTNTQDQDNENDEDYVAPLINPKLRQQSNTEDATNVVNPNDALAQSPTESMSSLDSVDSNPAKPAFGGRRLSNVSDEERERARLYREGALNKNGIDLAHIARTSYGIAQSPPATSPTKVKNGFNFTK